MPERSNNHKQELLKITEDSGRNTGNRSSNTKSFKTYIYVVIFEVSLKIVLVIIENRRGESGL